MLNLRTVASGIVDTHSSAFYKQDVYPLGGLHWVVVTREQADEDQAKVLTDFLYWFIAERDDKSLDIALLPSTIQQAAIARVEEVLWSGRPVFEAPRWPQRGGDGCVPRQRFQPRQRDAQVLIAGSLNLQPIIAIYQNMLRKGSIVYEAGKLNQAIQDLFDGDVDAVVADRCLTALERRVGLEKHNTVYCMDCGHKWQHEESWFQCRHGECKHHQMVRYNTAEVVSHLTLDQLVEGYEGQRRRSEGQTNTATGEAQPNA
jgi:hypothetical protein